MPQMQLPMFPVGFTAINNQVGFEKRDGRVAYFYGHLPVFQHEASDVQSFRLFTSQMITQGTASQTEIVKAFGVPLITVKRYVKVLREEGSKGFFAERERRSAPVLTPEMLRRVQSLLDAGKSVPEIAGETQVRADTLHKAIRAGRLLKKRF
jgi:transposase